MLWECQSLSVGAPRLGWQRDLTRGAGLGRDGGGHLIAKSCPAFVTPWTVAHQASLSMGFSRQEYWSGLPFPSPGDLPNPGIEPRSPALQEILYRLSYVGNTGTIGEGAGAQFQD